VVDMPDYGVRYISLACCHQEVPGSRSGADRMSNRTRPQYFLCGERHGSETEEKHKIILPTGRNLGYT
jgi:hypothetical protein